MDAKTKKDLELHMLEKAKEFLELVRDFIPNDSHASMCVWKDHIFVDIYSGPDSDGQTPCVIHAWADPRSDKLEVHPL